MPMPKVNPIRKLVVRIERFVRIVQTRPDATTLLDNELNLISDALDELREEVREGSEYLFYEWPAPEIY